MLKIDTFVSHLFVTSYIIHISYRQLSKQAKSAEGNNERKQRFNELNMSCSSKYSLCLLMSIPVHRKGNNGIERDRPRGKKINSRGPIDQMRNEFKPYRPRATKGIIFPIDNRNGDIRLNFTYLHSRTY